MAVDHGVYGTIMGGASKGPYSTGRKVFNIACLVWLLFGPLLVFGTLFGLLSFSARSGASWVLFLVAALIGLLVLYLAYSTFDAFQKYKNGEGSYQAVVLMGLLFLSMFGAFLLAAVMGEKNYQENQKGYDDLSSMNTYSGVNVCGGAGNSMSGVQLQDAGRIVFAPDTHVAVGLGSGFRDHKTYCVAPITCGDNTTSTGVYDLWAVGINCCIPNNPMGAQKWWCPDALNPAASSGLRLTNDADHAYYRMAVQQVEAAFNIKASHPIFFTWTLDPFADHDAMRKKSANTFLFGFAAFAVWQLFIVICAAFYFVRHEDDDAKPAQRAFAQTA